MLIALAVLDCRKIAACISRYSCNVTITDCNLRNFPFFACISRYSCNVTVYSGNFSVYFIACISRYLCNVTDNFEAMKFADILPALAGIRVMLRQLFIYCYYQLRSLKVAKPVLNEH